MYHISIFKVSINFRKCRNNFLYFQIWCQYHKLDTIHDISLIYIKCPTTIALTFVLAYFGNLLCFKTLSNRYKNNVISHNSWVLKKFYKFISITFYRFLYFFFCFLLLIVLFLLLSFTSGVYLMLPFDSSICLSFNAFWSLDLYPLHTSNSLVF